jgi:hypothetical protein
MLVAIKLCFGKMLMNFKKCLWLQRNVKESTLKFPKRKMLVHSEIVKKNLVLYITS